MMPDISPNKNMYTDLSALAAGLGDPALEERAKELRTLAGENVAEGFSPPSGPWNAKAFRYKDGGPNADLSLALALKSAWVGFYGPDTALWPQRLKDSLETIEAGAGFGNFGQNLTSAFQNLRLEDATVPAFEAGMEIIRSSGLQAAPSGFNWRNLKVATPEESGLIPSSAARAGLSFVSSPFALVVPIWAGGIAGRAVTGFTANIGRALALADEATVGIATLFGLTSEAAGFVAAGNATQYVAEGFSPPPEPWNPKGFRYSGSFLQEIGASTLFFGCLRLFGWTGSLARSLLPATETGLALANLTGHTASVTGLAATEELQEMAGIGQPAVVAQFGSSSLQAAQNEFDWRNLKVATPVGTTFSEKLWRAAFLHGTLHSVNGAFALDPAPRPSDRFAQIQVTRRFANGAFGEVLAQTPALAWATPSAEFSVPPNERPFGPNGLPGPAEPSRAGDTMRSFQELGEAAKRGGFAAKILRDMFVQHSNITALRLLIRAAEVNADSAEVLLDLAMNNRVVLDRIRAELDIQALGGAARTDDKMVSALEALHRLGMTEAWKGLAIAATTNMYAVYLLGQIAEPNNGPAHAALATMPPKRAFDGAMKLDKWGINAAWTLVLHKNTGLIGMFKAADINEAVQAAGNGTAEAALLFLLCGANHPVAFEAARNIRLDGLALAAERGDAEAVFVLDDYKAIGNVNAHEKMAKLDISAYYASAERGQTSPFHLVEALRVMARNGNSAAVEALANFDIDIFLMNRSPLLKIPLIRLAEAGNVSAAEEVAKMIEEKAVADRERFRVVTRVLRPIYEETNIARAIRELKLHALKAYAARETRGVRLLARLSKLGVKQAGEILFNLAMGEHSARAKDGDANALDALAVGTRAGNWRALNGIVIAIKEGNTEFVRAKALQTLGSLVLEGVKIAVSVYNANFPGRPLRRQR